MSRNTLSAGAYVISACVRAQHQAWLMKLFFFLPTSFHDREGQRSIHPTDFITQSCFSWDNIFFHCVQLRSAWICILIYALQRVCLLRSRCHFKMILQASAPMLYHSAVNHISCIATTVKRRGRCGTKGEQKWQHKFYPLTLCCVSCSISNPSTTTTTTPCCASPPHHVQSCSSMSSHHYPDGFCQE